MIIYNILIGILILLLIYVVVLIIQNYNSNPSPTNQQPSPIEPVKPHRRQPINPPGPVNPPGPINPPAPFNPPGPVNPPAPFNPPEPVNPPGPINPPAPFNPPGPINPPVLPSPTSTWTEDNIIELDSYLRNFFTNLFLLHTVPKREPIKDDTYKYIEEAIMDKYSYTEYKNIFVDFSKYEYIGRSSDNLYYWQNKFFKPIPFPSDDNINLAVFILENLDKYQPLTKLSFENMYNYYGGEDWGDNTQQAEDCIYDTVSKYNLIPITYIFFTTLYTNLNLSIGFNRDSYPKDNNYISIIQDYFDKKSNPIDDYCVNKLGIK